MKSMDIREQLDQAIGHGPPLPPPEQRLAAGRTAVRHRHIRMAAGAAAVLGAAVLPIATMHGSLTSVPAVVGTSSTSPTRSADASQPIDGRTTGEAGGPTLEVVVVDGVPQLADHPPGLTIGPVVRSGESAFGLETRVEGERSFVLLLQGAAGWQVNQLVTAEPGDDLASWLRTEGWLPTGEGS